MTQIKHLVQWTIRSESYHTLDPSSNPLPNLFSIKKLIRNAQRKCKNPTWWCDEMFAAAAAATAAGNKNDVILFRSKSIEAADEATERWWCPPPDPELEWLSFGSFGFRGPRSCCTAADIKLWLKVEHLEQISSDLNQFWTKFKLQLKWSILIGCSLLRDNFYWTNQNTTNLALWYLANG